MKAKLLVFLAMVGLLISFAACSQVQAAPNGTSKEKPASTPKTIEVSIDEFSRNKNLSRTIELNSGDTLTLILGANATTGFSWPEQATISEFTIIEQTEHKYIEPVSENGQVPGVGASGKDVWVFKSIKQGTSEISLDYSRPWEGGEKGEWTFRLTVLVK